MKCPKCKRKLVITGHSRYQNLIEHVSNPNGLPSNKPEYRCPIPMYMLYHPEFYRKCYPRRIFWDEFGDVYIPPSFIQRIFWKLNMYGVGKNIKVPNAKKND